jgi:all-trans-retinol 13,14-reductase
MNNYESFFKSPSRRDFIKFAGAVSASFSFNRLQIPPFLIGKQDKWPVVVIGAGLGGLSAAAHLAKAGFPVTLVERHYQPGGYATTFQRADGKFDFEVSLHATSAANGGLRAALEGAGVLGKVETAELPELCRIITPDYDMVWPQRNPDAIADQLCGLFPQEAEGIKKLFAEVLGILDEASLPFNAENPQERMQFPMTHPKMWNIRTKTLKDFLDGFISDPRLRSIFSSFWGYCGLPPSKLSGFYYAIVMASYMSQGGHYIVPRSQALSSALMQAVQDNGGKVLLETEVTGIRITDGAVSAVSLDDGTELPAKVVISNASVPKTMDMLSGGELPTEAGPYLKKLEDYHPSISTFAVWLGLNKEIRERIKSYEVFINPGYDTEEDYQATLACDAEKCSFIITIYDNAFKGYSKPGTSTLTVAMLSGYEPWRRFETDYFAGRKGEYNVEKERIANILIERAEKLVIPNLSSMIEVKEAATPLTNVFFTANPEGAIYGYEQSMANSYMNRLPLRTPIRGLYCASAWTQPGGGFQPCLQSGRNAVGLMMRDFEAGV